MRLLLVEDSAALVEALLPRLKQSGYAVDWVPNGCDAELAAFDDTYDVAVLDLGLPGRNGLEVLRQWRAAKLPMPVLVLTARDSFADRIDGLRAGADDYLTKPFHTDELLLRLQALLRHQRGMTNAPKLQAGALTLDEQRQSVSRDGVEIMLGGMEFRLLRYFMLHQGQLLSRGQLEEHLYEGGSERDSNVLEVHINRLRRKLGRDVIETRRGQGYRFVGGVTTGDS